MLQPRGGLLRHAVSIALAPMVLIPLAAGPAAAARRREPFTQGDIAPAAAYARDTLLAVRSQPSRGGGSLYVRVRATLAQKVAAAVGADAATIDRDWSITPDERLLVVYSALAQVGAPYRYATSDPAVGFDCSGLTEYAWGTGGRALAHSSRAQIRAAAPIAVDDVQPGDLVYYPGHVSLAVDDGVVVHAPHRGAPVEVRVMWTKPSVRIGDPTA
jgi:cell wall-associated NlpC family hydrolase